MTKRADGKYPPNKRDLYRTPEKAIVPLLRYLVTGTHFVDPCAGDGFMAGLLERQGLVCDDAYDIKPLQPLAQRASAPHVYVRKLDMLKLSPPPVLSISNPPWSILDDLLSRFYEAWWLLPSDWKETRRAQPWLGYCSMIVAVGRVGWMHNGGTGFDNADWYRFHADGGRQARFVNTW